MRFSKFCVVLTVICGVFAPDSGSAGLVIQSFSGGSNGVTNIHQTTSLNILVGSNDVVISKLGFYDHNADGLLASHEVAIWTWTGGLVTSATVPAGTVAELIGQWRMVDITPVTLNANQKYRIGTQVFGDRYIFNGFVGPFDPAVGPVAPRSGYINGPGLNFPASDASGRYNANAFISTSSVPEPSSILLLGLCALGCVAIRSQRKGALR